MLLFEREKLETRLLPQLERFRPDLLFISAGFDAHVDDMYHFLTEQDMHWVTEQLCAVVERVNGIGVISVLEGGYSLAAPHLGKEKKLPTSVSAGVGTRGRSASATGSSLSATPEEGKKGFEADLATMFAQQAGDGGLVKRSGHSFPSSSLPLSLSCTAYGYRQCIGAYSGSFRSQVMV